MIMLWSLLYTYDLHVLEAEVKVELGLLADVAGELNSVDAVDAIDRVLRGKKHDKYLKGFFHNQ